MKIIANIGIWLVCMLAVIIAVPWSFVAIFYSKNQFWEFARAFDRLGNVAAGGSDREFLSAHASRARREGRRWGCVLCGILDRIEKDHCAKAESPSNLTIN